MKKNLVLDAIKAVLCVSVRRSKTACQYIRSFLSDYGEPILTSESNLTLYVNGFSLSAIIAWRTNEIDLAVYHFYLSFCFRYLITAQRQVMVCYLLDAVLW